jgi:flagellar biosynthesis protein FlhG
VSGSQQQARTRIISIGGGKGGVGKSIVSCNLAVAMAQLGHKTVLADLDLGAANQHLLLGIDRPRPGIDILMSRGGDDPREGLTPTRVPNLSLIAGSGATLGAANIKYQEKVKLLRKLRALDADVVIIDVGAGVGYNALDFFELGAQRLVVTTPQVTAIHDAYAFLKGAVLRTLHHHAEGAKQIALLETAEQSGDGEKVVEILARIKEREPAFAERIFQVLSRFGTYLIGNQVSNPAQAGVFHAVSKMMQDYLGIGVPILGWLRATDEIHQSVNERLPMILSRKSENAQILRNMAETLLLEDVVVEDDLILEVEDDGTSPTDNLMLAPDALRVPVVPAADGGDALMDQYADEAAEPEGPRTAYVGGKARIYQPPPRKKKRAQKKRPADGTRRRKITLPGLTPAASSARPTKVHQSG